ncbi:Spermatogenesis-Associated Protein 31C1-Like [Manis pentadactyla]|nr:Spermatogenesis-Associated Protein 31C1-Like [Manis pentadactyla]
MQEGVKGQQCNLPGRKHGSASTCSSLGPLEKAKTESGYVIQLFPYGPDTKEELFLAFCEGKVTYEQVSLGSLSPVHTVFPVINPCIESATRRRHPRCRLSFIAVVKAENDVN